jgi:hypothetical protein
LKIKPTRDNLFFFWGAWVVVSQPFYGTLPGCKANWGSADQKQSLNIGTPDWDGFSAIPFIPMDDGFGKCIVRLKYKGIDKKEGLPKKPCK